MRVAKLGSNIGRGIWIAPWMGENGELVLVAVTSSKRRIKEVEIPFGANHLDTAIELLELLDQHDPEIRTRLKAI